MSADPIDPNRLWIGTFGSGLCAFDKRTGKCKRYTVKKGLPDNVIYSALPDRRGNVWMGTNKGLCRLNIRTLKVRTYTRSDGILADEFNRHHYIQMPDGQIIMAGLEGFTSFYPDQITDDQFKPGVQFTSLEINNKIVESSSDSVDALPPVQAMKLISLPYDKNFITLQFAAMQYNNPAKNSYRYRLNGLDKSWVESNVPRAVYTGLSPGRYTLNVNAANTSGIWSDKISTLSIVISPPYWASWWAYMLYAFITASFIWYWIGLYLARARFKQASAFRLKEAVQQQQINEMKNRFFANITHELRTPLTLILSPAETLMQQLNDTAYAKPLTLINRNAKILLDMVNNLLDLSKIDADAMPVETLSADLGEFVRMLVSDFEEHAQLKGVEMLFESNISGMYQFDAAKLGSIITNLLSNALKFTAFGKITVKLEDAGIVKLWVSDTGTGISKEDLVLIFNRFYSINKAGGVNTGTGIGLALVKELVDLQNGTISVESMPGKGSTFLVQIPYQRGSIKDKQYYPYKRVSYLLGDTGFEAENPDYIPTILVVEDNAELAEFIADCLPEHYRIIRAEDGRSGLYQATEILPDLIISDVMMPYMDGYALCRALKNDLRTSHIPVILLTAKAAYESKIEGLSQGADDYMTKPFYADELRLRVANLIEQRRLMQNHIRLSLSPSGTVTDTDKVQDPFLEKLYGHLESKLDSAAYGVENLALDLFMSRVTLHRKVKAVSGLAPGDVIRNYRLKRAAEFLKTGLNSSETAEITGFDSPSYFAKSFRAYYNISPSEFIQKELTDKNKPF